jgi:hypothetical protein
VTKSKCGRKEADAVKKFGKKAFPGFDPCNPLIYHKTAKAFFGNPCRKQTEIWKSLEKKLGDRLYFAASAPSTFGYLNRQPTFAALGLGSVEMLEPKGTGRASGSGSR